MEVDKGPPKYDPKTMQDENGHYPVWYKSRDIKKAKSKQAGKKGRTGPKKGKNRRKGIAW